MARRRAPSPSQSERERAEDRQREFDGWWLRFCAEGPWRSMEASSQALVSFAAYVSRTHLFCSYVAPRRCAEVTFEQVKAFLLETVPRNVVVDAPRAFFEQTHLWLRWLAQAGLLEHGADIARGLSRGAWRKDALLALQTAKGGPGKDFIVQARNAGIDVADAEAMLNHALSQRPGDRHWAQFCREFLEPPYPAFDRGRALHVIDWPPEDS